MKERYTRGEFARLNGVSPFTLRLYDRLGLLKPAYTDEKNGYHYYTPQQSPSLMRIMLCCKAGLSLKEIRHYQLSGMSGEEVGALYTRVVTNLEQELAALSASLCMVRSLKHYAVDWQTHGMGNPYLVEDLLFQGFVSESFRFSEENMAAETNAFTRQCEDVMGHQIEYPCSYFVDSSDDGLRVQVVIRTSQPWDTPNFVSLSDTRTHLAIAFQGDYSQQIPLNLETLRRYAREHHYQICGPAIMTSVQYYLYKNQDNLPVLLLGCPVKPA